MKYLLPVVCSIFLIGCGDSTQTEAPLAPQTETQAEATVNQTSEMADAGAGAKTMAPETVEAPAAETKPATPVTAAAATAAATAASSAAAAATTAASSATEAATKAAAAVDGAAVFVQKCASCHGMKAEKAALGKSQVIAGWSEQRTKEALKGYQAGTYGKDMKALMQGQAKALSDVQIDALAKHIAGL